MAFPMMLWSGNDYALWPREGLPGLPLEVTGCTSALVDSADIFRLSGNWCVAKRIVELQYPVWVKIWHTAPNLVRDYVQNCETYHHPDDGRSLSGLIRGYVLFDEPERFYPPIPPDVMRGAYFAAKEVTSRPIWLNTGGWNPSFRYKAWEYMGIADISSWDDYPWEDNSNCPANSPSYYTKSYAAYLQQCAQFAQYWHDNFGSAGTNKVLGAVLQSFSFSSGCYSNLPFSSGNSVNITDGHLMALTGGYFNGTYYAGARGVPYGNYYEAFALYVWDDGGYTGHTNIAEDANIANAVASFNQWVKNQDWYSRFPEYDVSTTVAMPSFSPGGGTYSTSQTVTIACSTSGATIRYTTNGTDPNTSYGTVIASGNTVNIATTTDLRAVAYKTGLNTSAINRATYTISSVPPPQLVLTVTSGQIPMPSGGTIIVTASQPISLWESSIGWGSSFEISYPSDSSISITYLTNKVGYTQLTLTATASTGAVASMVIPFERTAQPIALAGASYPTHYADGNLASYYLALALSRSIHSVSGALTVDGVRVPITIMSSVRSEFKVYGMLVPSDFVGMISEHRVSVNLSIDGIPNSGSYPDPDPRVMVKFEITPNFA